MKPVTRVSVDLIILGMLALANRGIMYTTRGNVIDHRPLTASVEAVEAAERHS